MYDFFPSLLVSGFEKSLKALLSRVQCSLDRWTKNFYETKKQKDPQTFANFEITVQVNSNLKPVLKYYIKKVSLNQDYVP